MFLYILGINPLSDVCILLCGPLIFLITVPVAGIDAFILHKVPFARYWPYLLMESLEEVLLMHKKLLPGENKNKTKTNTNKQTKETMANGDKGLEVERFFSQSSLCL